MGKFDAAPTLAAGILRLARFKAGISQAELAGRAGVTQQAVSAYETGRREPTLPTLERLIQATGHELRFHLEPISDHDASLGLAIESLGLEQRGDVERKQLDRRERARLERVRGR
jgi:transcriptional regulator with XRE-family HTH domain